MHLYWTRGFKFNYQYLLGVLGEENLNITVYPKETILSVVFTSMADHHVNPEWVVSLVGDVTLFIIT